MLDLLFRGRPLVFQSALSHNEITKRLEREVAPATWQWRDTRTQLFEGTWSGGRFRMVRLVHGRNSFRPIIVGQVSPGSHGVRIDVRLGLHPVVVGLCVILLAIGGVLIASAMSEPAAARVAAPQAVLLIGLAVLAGFAMVAGVEARTATRLLAGLFEAEPSRPSGRDHASTTASSAGP